MPDLTILLRLDPEKGSSRIADREHDRIEQASDAFHRKVYEGYLELEKNYPERIFGVDASGTIEEIAEEIRRRVRGVMDR
jgi:dTMP kinase